MWLSYANRPWIRSTKPAELWMQATLFTLCLKFKSLVIGTWTTWPSRPSKSLFLKASLPCEKTWIFWMTHKSKLWWPKRSAKSRTIFRLFSTIFGAAHAVRKETVGYYLSFVTWRKKTSIRELLLRYILKVRWALTVHHCARLSNGFSLIVNVPFFRHGKISPCKDAYHRPWERLTTLNVV